MFLLNKIFQLRDHVNPDHEKPFLEHLEDLRGMLLRIVVTLVVSMLVCFSFQEKLMEVLRRPVEKVWMDQLLDKLPQGKDPAVRPVSVDTWERAKSVEHAVLGLEGGPREEFFKALADDNLRFHAQAVELLRAALALPKDKRDGFVGGLAVPDDLKAQVRCLIKTAPSPEIDNRGNLRLMSALKPTETFMLSMKLSFFAGIVISFPLLLMFVLQFVLPGMHANEKQVLWPSMAIGFGLFLGGVLFAYYAVLPRALGLGRQTRGVQRLADWRIHLVCHPVHAALRLVVRIAGGGDGVRQIGFAHLRYDGPHPLVCHCGYLRGGGNSNADAGCADHDVDGRADGRALRNLHLAGLVRCAQKAPDRSRRRGGGARPHGPLAHTGPGRRARQ